MYQLSSDISFHFEALRVIAAAPYEGADIAEVLQALANIKPGDFDDWHDAFFTLAKRVQGVADAIDPVKFPVSARQALFRASTYYRVADFYLHGKPEDPRINSLWKLQAEAFDRAIALLPIPGQRVNIQAKSFTVPIVFYRCGKPKAPTLIMGTGYDGSQEEVYHHMGMAAVQRGINVITYEGPGQPTVRREQNIGFIPNWEEVITPIVDFAVKQDEVNTEQIGLVGLSFGGYLAPRAAAFEHRLAAVMAIDGVFDFGAALERQWPAEMKGLVKAGDTELIDAAVSKMLATPGVPAGTRWGIQQGLWSFNTRSASNFFEQIKAYTMEGVTDKIKAPVFVADAEEEMFFPGQAPALAERLGDLATYYMFKAADGAGSHCSVGANVFINQVVLDWFQGVLSKKQ